MLESIVLGWDGVLATTSFEDARLSSNIRVLECVIGDHFRERVIVRPNAVELLQKVRKYCKHLILAENTPKKRLIAEAKQSGLFPYFDRVFCREDILLSEGVVLSGGDPNYVGCRLGDDFGLVSTGVSIDDDVRTKLSFFGVPIGPMIREENAGTIVDTSVVDDHLIQIQEFRGDPDDCYLLDLLWAFSEADKLERMGA